MGMAGGEQGERLHAWNDHYVNRRETWREREKERERGVMMSKCFTPYPHAHNNIIKTLRLLHILIVDKQVDLLLLGTKSKTCINYLCSLEDNGSVLTSQLATER
jgi:hypothetical protein